MAGWLPDLTVWGIWDYVVFSSGLIFGSLVFAPITETLEVTLRDSKASD